MSIAAGIVAAAMMAPPTVDPKQHECDEKLQAQRLVLETESLPEKNTKQHKEPKIVEKIDRAGNQRVPQQGVQ